MSESVSAVLVPLVIVGAALCYWTIKRSVEYYMSGCTMRKPWREFDWQSIESVRQFINSFEASETNKVARLIPLGIIGAGKSSFIETVATSIKKRQVDLLDTGDAAGSLTRQFSVYEFFTSEDTKLNFQMCDVWGFEEKTFVSDLALASNLACIFDGRIPEGYKYEDEHSNDLVRHESIRKEPARSDRKIHCTCFCVSMESASYESDKKVFDTFRKVSQNYGVTKFLVVTKPDLCCPKVTPSNLQHIFHCRHIKEKVAIIASLFGVPLKRIFIQCNFTEKNSPQVEILTLYNLQMILQACKDGFQLKEGRGKREQELESEKKKEK